MNIPSLQDQAQQVAELIKRSRSIAVLTGAGISTHAGIPDFRGPQGLYVTRKYDADKVFNLDYFLQDPLPFFDFARDFVTLQSGLKPTMAHRFWARLEQEGLLAGLVTQNIDSLHQLAGSKRVFEIHGSFARTFCWECGHAVSEKELIVLLTQYAIPKCSCGGLLKPDVVFFGENVKCLAEAVSLAASADLLFVVGTSCAVFPAGAIPTYCAGRIVVVNFSPLEIPLANDVLWVKEDIDAFFYELSRTLWRESML